MTQPVNRSCWCGSERAAPVGVFDVDGRRFALVQCCGCGVQAIHPAPDDNDLLSYYSPEYYGATREKFVGPIALAVAWFQAGRARMTARHTSSGGRILDIGCGNGGFLIRMKRRGFQVEGTEWTAQSAARVPASEQIPVHVGDLLDLDLPQRAYDTVTMWHVLEHVRHPHKVLERISGLLKPGGKLLLSLPNAESRQAKKFGTDWFHYDPPRHLFDFGVRSLSQLLERTGFDVQWTTTFSLEQNTFGVIQSWLNRRGYPRDRLYSELKGFAQQSPRVRWLDFGWLAALIGPALVISFAEAMAGAGATMTMCARLRER